MREESNVEQNTVLSNILLSSTYSWLPLILKLLYFCLNDNPLGKKLTCNYCDTDPSS